MVGAGVSFGDRIPCVGAVGPWAPSATCQIPDSYGWSSLAGVWVEHITTMNWSPVTFWISCIVA